MKYQNDCWLKLDECYQALIKTEYNSNRWNQLKAQIDILRWILDLEI